MPTATLSETETDTWRRVLRGDEAMQEYFAARSTLGDATLFTCPQMDEFNLALVDAVAPLAADAVLAGIVRHYRARGVTPRVRITPLAVDPAWPERLARAGFAETGEGRRFWIVPAAIKIGREPGVVVTRATTEAEADRFAAIQAAAFGVPPAVRAWDRDLARRHVAAGRDRFYLGWADGEAVCAAASVPLEPGLTGMWGLATLPCARRRGVGRVVLGQMLDDIHAAGGGLIFFTTAWDNPIAAAYLRLGFAPLFATRTFALGARDGCGSEPAASGR